MVTLASEELLDTLRAHSITAWARPSSSYGEPGWTRHIHVIREPTREPGQTARQYRQRRRAWKRYTTWQRRRAAAWERRAATQP